MSNFKNNINIISELGKFKITFFVSISGSVGYLLAGGDISFDLILAVIGIFILSSGSAAFNHYQEVDTDKIMKRTQDRPLPSNKISKDKAMVIASLMTLIGLSILFFFNNTNAFLLGILALIWYNVIYTPLKKVTSMAIMPGALVGAIPPAIGWAAGGGSMLDPKIYALAMFFFIWQIPHFWFLQLIFDEDYRKAGFPTLREKFKDIQIQRMTYAWIVALAASGMLIPLFGMTENLITNILLFIAGSIIVWRTASLLVTYHEKKKLRFAFRDINFYVLAVVILLSVDRFI